MRYLVRSVTPGTFYWQGAEARLQYSPEEFGRSQSVLQSNVSADSTLVVTSGR